MSPMSLGGVSVVIVKFLKTWVVNLLIAVGSILAVTMLILSLLSPWFITNIDQSLPGWVYEIDRHAMPVRHQIAGIKVPRNPYYPDGAPFLKIIGGIPGDVVTRHDNTFYVNGVAMVEVKTETQNGYPLTPGPTGIIPPGRYFVFTPHKDSYDSRYAEIGWITSEHILGTARRIW